MLLQLSTLALGWSEEYRIQTEGEAWKKTLKKKPKKDEMKTVYILNTPSKYYHC